MQTTRRTFLEAVGATAALGVMGGSNIPTVLAGERGKANALPATTEKVLFWVAVSTPCDMSLKFDEELYKDLLAYLKANGADGVVVLGTTGEFPSFSTAERKKVAETAFKHRNGLNIIVSSGTSNFPETLELSQHAEANGADGLLVVPPWKRKEIRRSFPTPPRRRPRSISHKPAGLCKVPHRTSNFCRTALKPLPRTRLFQPLRGVHLLYRVRWRVLSEYCLRPSHRRRR